MWLISFVVPAGTHEPFEAALQPICRSVAAFETDDRCLWQIDGFADPAPDPAALDVAIRLAAAAADVGLPDVRLQPIEPRDWLAENLQTFPPIQLGQFWIYGDHDADSPVPDGLTGLMIDAALAFGSGRHASTAGCLLALGSLRPTTAIRRPFDLGCGSGILTLAMARLFRTPVLAADVDARAVAETARNAARNGLKPAVRAVVSNGCRAPLIRSRAPFDLITANILADPLRRLAPQLSAVLAPTGTIILSGFITDDARSLLAAYTSHGLVFQRQLDRDGWSTLILRRPLRR